MVVCLLSFIPGDDWRKTNLVHAREEGECCEDERGPDELVLVEEGNELEWLENVSYLHSVQLLNPQVCVPSPWTSL